MNVKHSVVSKYLFWTFAAILLAVSAFGIILTDFKEAKFILMEGRNANDIDGVDGISYFCDVFPYLSIGAIVNLIVFVKILHSYFWCNQFKKAAIESSLIVVWLAFILFGGSWTWTLCRYLQSHPDSYCTKLLEPVKLELPKHN